MKKFFLVLFIVGSGSAQAKLNDQQSMKCIDGDKLSHLAFQDLQAAYEMRLVSAKDFLKVMEAPLSCPQLREDLKKLQASAFSAFPQGKPPFRPGKANSVSDFNEPRETKNNSLPHISPPPFPRPPPMSDADSDFDEEDEDDFSDFR